MRTPLLFTALLLAIPTTSRAQVEAPRPHGCFQPHPADRCAWFPLIETNIQYRIAGDAPEANRMTLDWRIGLMKNTSRRSAIGGVLFATAEGDFRAGAAVRARRWLSPSTSLDLSAGLNAVGTTNQGRMRAASPTIDVRIASHDYLAATARLDLVRIQPYCYDPSCAGIGPVTTTRLYVGVGTGAVGGIVGFVATGVLAVIALIAIGGSGFAY